MPGINFDHPGSDISADSGTMKIDGAAAFTAADKVVLDASGADQVARNNIMLNAFRIAINGGLSVLNMEDGLVDEFEDETGVDTGTSSNEIYDSTGDFYKNVGFIPTFSETLDTDQTRANYSIRVVLEAAVISTSGSACKITFEAGTGGGFDIDLCYIGEKASSGDAYDMKSSTPTPVKVTFSGGSDGFGIGASATIESDDVSFVIDSSKAYVIAFDVGAAGTIWTLSSLADVESYIKISANEAHLANVSGYGTTARLYAISRILVLAGPLDMSLQSNAFSAVTPSDPTEARIVLFEEDVDSVTLNTDLKAYASRDGTTFTQITLTDEGDYETGKAILTGTIDISGQPAGASMKWKLTTHNAKEIKVHGVALQWS